MTNEEKKEIQRCKRDIIYFIEKYMVNDGKPIILNEYSKMFIRKYHKDFNNEQLKCIITGFKIVDILKEPIISFKSLENFPQKTTEEFKWNISKIKNQQ